MSKSTIRAIRVHQFGGPEQLKLEQIERPEPKEGEILVRVHAAGVLPADCATLRGSFIQKQFPYIPGTAFAGVVEEVGPGVTDFYKGQAICGRAPNGSTSEYTTIITNPSAIKGASEATKFSAAIAPLAPKPEKLSFDEAATLSGGATTAWNALFEDGNVQAGQRVLIHGAAGGVGLFAVQFAKWKGAHVIGTASTNNIGFVRSLGADTVIDYTTTAFEDVVQDVDFVLDTMGGEIMERSMRIVKPGGTLISIYGNPPEELAKELGIHAIHNQVFPNSTQLRKIVQLIDERHVRPVIRKVFPLEEASQAYELCETGHGRGRIILHIAD